MFFNDSLLKLAIEELNLENDQTEYYKFYHDLINKKYTIVYHFDVDTDALFYEAFVKENVELESKTRYAVLKISFFNTKPYTVEDAVSHPIETTLAFYIYEIDLEKSNRDFAYFDRKYHFVPENLRHFTNMDSETKEQFIDSRQDFINILNTIDKTNVANNSDKEAQFANEFLKTRKDIFVKVDENTYKFGDGWKQLPIDKPVQIYQNDNLFDAISAIRGQNLFVNGKEYRIQPTIYQGSIYVDEFNKVVLAPNLRFLNQKRFFYDSNKNFIEVNLIRKAIRLITFENRTSAIFYSYFIQNPIVKIDYIKDLLEARLGTDFTKIFIPRKTQDIEAHFLHIDYHVNLRITNSLEFSTVFRMNNKIFTREDLMKNYFYKNVVLEFEEILKELKLPENSAHTNINVLDFLTLDLSKLRKIAHIVLDESIQEKKITTKPDITFSASRKNDWFEIDVISKTYTNEDIDKIFAALKEKRNYIVINDDVIDLNNLENKKDLLEVYEFKHKFEKEFPMYEIFRLEALRQSTGIEITYDSYVKNVLYEIKNYKEVKVDIPEHIKKVLRPYQYEAVQWMSTLSRNGLAGILADDMGLGKTLETIAYLETLKEEDPVLIVCPKSVTYNWLNEFEKWQSSYSCEVIEGNKDVRDTIIANIQHERKVYIVSYDTLRNDIENLSECFFNIVILDESQYIKNADALKSKAVKQLQAKYRFSLTGTPVENGLSDLWSIFDFLMPGYLLDYSEFRSEYEYAFEPGKENEPIKHKLIAKITPFIFKRTKKDVLTELPEKTTTVVSIALTDEQQDIYSTYLRKTKLMLRNKTTTTTFRILQGILRLRQICVDPTSFLLNYRETPSKISFTIDMIEEVLKNDSKVIVYSSFVTVLQHTQQCLKALKIPTCMIDGNTTAQNRTKFADRFNNTDEVKVMLVSIKAGGTGLNLIGADTVIILDPWWNSAVEEQAADRAYRLGQTKPVNVFKLIAHNTIEEKIIKLQEQKKELYEKLVRGDTDGISGLTDEDIQYIFS